nr:RecName: Full=C-type lectin 65 kDa subunit [Petromyzon marinus]
SWANLNTFGR